MQLVDGVVLTDVLPEPLDNPGERERIARELIDGLVELHRVDWRACGLDGFGKPSGYLERQLRRFGGLWEHNRTREIREFAQVAAWLSANIPPSPPATIVHGDYRLGNTMFTPTAPAQLRAIFDWEMATIGDPLADVGYLMIHWAQEGDPTTRFNLQRVTTLPGFPSRAQMVARYERCSGRRIQALEWYVTFALWKAAVFMEGNYKRTVDGSSDDQYARSFADGVIELIHRAQQVSEEGL